MALENPAIDTVFLGGGAGGGKTWFICETRLINALRYPGYRSFIGRNELTRLMQSTYITWCKVSQFHKIPAGTWHLNGQYHYIDFTNGSRIDLLDLKYLPSDPLYERFGSLEYSDGALEEAGEIHALAYDVMKSRIGRHQIGEVKPTMVITGNPKKNWTYTEFYKPWRDKILPSNTVFIQSLFGDNPWTAETYGKQLRSIKDKITRQRLMLGNWEYEDDPSTLIDFEAITDLWTNSIPEDLKAMTVDVARMGKDKTVIFIWLGKNLRKVYIYKKQDTEVTRQKIRDMARTEQIPYSRIVIDEDGVGGGVVDSLKGVKGFIGGSSPLAQKEDMDRPAYRNLRTQCYYLLAETINTHKMAINCEVISDEPANFRDLLTEELEQVKEKNPDSDEKKLQIIPKEDIKLSIGRSPDFADALMMRMLLDLNASGEVDIIGLQRVQQNRTRRYEFQ